MFMPLPLSLPPGVVKNDSAETSKGRYIDTNFVRFWLKAPQKWLGWVKLIQAKLDSPARGRLDWVALDGTRLMAWGTVDKLWLMKDGQLYDITPAGLPPGNRDSIVPGAWGMGGWGAGGWGGGVPPGANGQARTWTLSKWGEDLIACPRGGTIYQWVYANGTGVKAQPIPNAPATALGIFVSDLRYLVAYGAHDGITDRPLRIAWTDQENLSAWPPNITNKSGDLLIENGNEIVGYCPTRGGWVFFTDRTLHFFGWVGGDRVFDLDRQGTGTGLIAPHAAIDDDGIIEWWGLDGFYRFDGTIQRLECDVQEYIFGNGRDISVGFNRQQAAKIVGSTNKAYNEKIWFYPSATSLENDSYVAHGPDGWSVGRAIDRTTWTDRNVISNSPIATAADGTIYQHDIGLTADGAPITYTLKTGNIHLDLSEQMAATDQFLRLRKAVPDYAYMSGDHNLIIEASNYSNLPTFMTKGPYTFNASMGHFPVKARGRALRFNFTGTGDFRMSHMTVYATPDGRRA